MYQSEVSPIDLRDYASCLGWTLVPEALKDGLFVLNSPERDFTQLIFSKDTEHPHYDEMMQISIAKLTELYRKSNFKIMEEIREVNDDVISLRYFSDSKSVNSLSFSEAIEVIEGTKQLLLSAASSVINPVLYHKRLSRTEPNDLLKKTRFRHTEEGSFIIKISCPLDYEVQSINLFRDESPNKPFARKTFELINRSSNEILNAIDTNEIDAFVDQHIKKEAPILSYNFCDALSELYDEERELPFELRFNWSLNSLKKIPIPILPSVIRFPFSIKPKIDQIVSYLKPESTEAIDTFLGSVESLNGNLDVNQQRSGEIRLALLIDDGIVNARVNLNAAQYAIADKAHMQPGAFIKIKGRLHPGKNIRVLDDVMEFSLVDLH